MKILILILVLLLSVSCGSMSITPRGCQTQGSWGSEETINDIKISESYYLTTDEVEVKLKDILAKHDIKCGQIKTLRIKINSSFFVKRTVEIYYTIL